MKFNINEYVRVKLTPEGRAAHAADFAADSTKFGFAHPYTPPQEDAEGWSRWQLWVLMKEFGPHIYLGGPAMFETEIDIPLASPTPEQEG
jgi:hypothetical protein